MAAFGNDGIDVTPKDPESARLFGIVSQQAIIWFAGLGLAVTTFGNLSALLQLSSLVARLSIAVRDHVYAAIRWGAGFIDIDLAPGTESLIATSVFTVLLCVSGRPRLGRAVDAAHAGRVRLPVIVAILALSAPSFYGNIDRIGDAFPGIAGGFDRIAAESGIDPAEARIQRFAIFMLTSLAAVFQVFRSIHDFGTRGRPALLRLRHDRPRTVTGWLGLAWRVVWAVMDLIAPPLFLVVVPVWFAAMGVLGMVLPTFAVIVGLAIFDIRGLTRKIVAAYFLVAFLAAFHLIDRHADAITSVIFPGG